MRKKGSSRWFLQFLSGGRNSVASFVAVLRCDYCRFVDGVGDGKSILKMCSFDFCMILVGFFVSNTFLTTDPLVKGENITACKQNIKSIPEYYVFLWVLHDMKMMMIVIIFEWRHRQEQATQHHRRDWDVISMASFIVPLIMLCAGDLYCNISQNKILFSYCWD